MILNTIASAVIVVEKKGNIGSNIFRQFLQRLKSPKCLPEIFLMVGETAELLLMKSDFRLQC